MVGFCHGGNMLGNQFHHHDYDDHDDYGKHYDNNDDCLGYPAHSHHDKIPPWWGNVSNDKGGKMSMTKSHHT